MGTADVSGGMAVIVTATATAIVGTGTGIGTGTAGVTAVVEIVTANVGDAEVIIEEITTIPAPTMSDGVAGDTAGIIRQTRRLQLLPGRNGSGGGMIRAWIAVDQSRMQARGPRALHASRQPHRIPQAHTPLLLRVLVQAHLPPRPLQQPRGPKRSAGRSRSV